MLHARRRSEIRNGFGSRTRDLSSRPGNVVIAEIQRIDTLNKNIHSLATILPTNELNARLGEMDGRIVRKGALQDSVAVLVPDEDRAGARMSNANEIPLGSGGED